MELSSLCFWNRLWWQPLSLCVGFVRFVKFFVGCLLLTHTVCFYEATEDVSFTICLIHAFVCVITFGNCVGMHALPWKRHCLHIRILALHIGERPEIYQPLRRWRCRAGEKTKKDLSTVKMDSSPKQNMSGWTLAHLDGDKSGDNCELVIALISLIVEQFFSPINFFSPMSPPRLRRCCCCLWHTLLSLIMLNYFYYHSYCSIPCFVQYPRFILLGCFLHVFLWSSFFFTWISSLEDQ